MFGAKKRRRRRSEMRLGAQSVRMQPVVAGPTLSLSPLFRFWQMRGHKLSGLAALGGLGLLLYWLFTLPAFFVYGADISGNQALSRLEIYRASGIDSQSVFWLNPEQVAAKIAALPNIKSAEVTITLPARVSIAVTERKPQVLWQTGDKVWWVDQEGTVVPPRTEVEGMLKIIDDDMQPLEVGYQIDQTIITGAQALQLLVPNVTVIRHTRAKGLIVATPEGWPVYLGNGSDMRAKLMVLSALLPDLRQEKQPPLYIDVRNPLRPVYKLKPEFKITAPLLQPRPVPLPFPQQRQPVYPPQRRP
ncbi:MAG: Cell division protein FtsQ [Anaerolineae bacterium]|nr:Cell division protein FtsQ [Anaerolineae bacterium]